MGTYFFGLLIIFAAFALVFFLIFRRFLLCWQKAAVVAIFKAIYVTITLERR